MIKDETIEAFNNRLTVNPNNTKNLTAAQLDKIKNTGSQAEALLANKQFAQFVHSFKFERVDILSEIVGHTAEDDKLRVALSHQIAGIDEFVKSLRRAVYYRDRVVTQQSKTLEPNS
jgi:hypothetical protein